MKKIFIFAAMAATALTACNKEEISAPDESRDNFVYREFNAVIEDGVSTRVAFGDPADGKIPVSFQNGDEIAITDGTNVYKGTVSVPEDGGNTIIATDVPETFTLSAAYYPYEAYTLKTDDEGNPIEPKSRCFFKAQISTVIISHSLQLRPDLL